MSVLLMIEIEDEEQFIDFELLDELDEIVFAFNQSQSSSEDETEQLPDDVRFNYITGKYEWV